MTLIKTSNEIESIRGSMAGNVFTRDSSGLHITAKPRRVKQCSVLQQKQRNAFSAARKLTKVNREVSYYIYRFLNGLTCEKFCSVTGDPDPNCTGNYYLSGTCFDHPYYTRSDNQWSIWFNRPLSRWMISEQILIGFPWFWQNTSGLEGEYTPAGLSTGNPYVTLNNYPVPIDYNPPHIHRPKIK